jgi:hypothetical protein
MREKTLKNMSKHKNTPIGSVVLLSGVVYLTGLAYGSQAPKVFDTVTAYDRPLSASQIRNRQQWKPYEGQAISGDLYIENDRIAAVLRKQAKELELYYRIGGSYAIAAALGPLVGDDSRAGTTESLEVVRPAEDVAVVKAQFSTGSQQPTGLEFVFRSGQPTIEVRPAKGTRKVSIKARSDYAVMPDLFADDLVFDLQKSKSDVLYLPRDNRSILQMIHNGGAIIVCNWLSGDGEIAVGPNKTQGNNPVTETTIGFNSNDNLWISILADREIWHKADAREFNIREYTQLNWTVPFGAHWRINYQRADRQGSGLTDSFWNARMHSDGTFKLVPNLLNMVIADGRYLVADAYPQKRLVRHSVMNEHTGSGWWTYRGWFVQPFYVDDNKAFVRNPKFDKRRTIRYAGPVVIYPLLSIDSAEEGTKTIEDVLSSTIGADYLDVLDLAELNRRPEKDHYPPTCPTTEYCERILEHNEERFRGDHIVAIMAEMNEFVTHTRQRIEQYVNWQRDLQSLCQESRDADPGLANIIKKIEKITDQIPSRFKAVRSKTPHRVGELSVKAASLVDHNGRAKVGKFKKICKQIRSVGDAQDELLGQLRDIAKKARQTVTLMHAEERDPQARELLRLIRAKTQEILRIRYDMEGK